MPSLTQLIKAAKNDLPITIRHQVWLSHNSNPVYSEAAVQHAQDVLSGRKGGFRVRRRSFRASGTGQCPRRRVFGFLGLPEIGNPEPSAVALFHTGDFMHLKWQMAGLTEGWLQDAEVPAYNEDLRLTGTMDGLLYDGSLFEFKSINHRGYTFLIREGPKADHVDQTTAYAALRPDIEKVSVVYEDKDNGEWREFRYVPDPDRVMVFRDTMDYLNSSVEAQELPPIKPECLQREGREFRRCPFRDVCLTVRSYAQAVELAGDDE